jgi:hypothetical protein
LKELCDYGASRGVGIVVWHAYPEGRDDGPGLTRPEARRELFRRCAEAGVKGVKIDFFNSERLEVVRVYEELARLAAEHRMMINFHGSHKPSGEVRTWPNEITREGIREQEYVLWDKLPWEHYAALPFTPHGGGALGFFAGLCAGEISAKHHGRVPDGDGDFFDFVIPLLARSSGRLPSQSVSRPDSESAVGLG